MEKFLCDKVEIGWVEDESVGLIKCPVCGHNPGYCLQVCLAVDETNFNDIAGECEKCHSKFVMEIHISVFKVVP